MTAPAHTPRLNCDAISLIKHFESLKLDAYRDPVGIPTIGYGHTDGVRLGTSITPVEAEELLRLDLNGAQADVLRSVKVPLNDNEYGALVSLVFNIGGPAFARSRCLALLNKGDRDGAADEFQRFVKGHVNGRKTTLRGLQLRRAAERDLFSTALEVVTNAPGSISGPASIALQPTAVPFSTPDVLTETAVALPGRWGKHRHIAVAAGMGTGLGAVPVLNGDSGQSTWDQINDLWHHFGAQAGLANAPLWFDAGMKKLSELAQGQSTRDLLFQFNGLLQSHTAVAAAVGVTAAYLARSALVRLFGSR